MDFITKANKIGFTTTKDLTDKLHYEANEKFYDNKDSDCQLIHERGPCVRHLKMDLIVFKNATSETCEVWEVIRTIILFKKKKFYY